MTPAPDPREPADTGPESPAESPESPPESYGAALAELTSIVTELDAGNLDVDRLTDRVERAVELVAWCRGRLEGVGLRVTEIVSHLEPDGPVTDDGGGTDDPPAV